MARVYCSFDCLVFNGFGAHGLAGVSRLVQCERSVLLDRCIEKLERAWSRLFRHMA